MNLNGSHCRSRQSGKVHLLPTASFRLSSKLRYVRSTFHLICPPPSPLQLVNTKTLSYSIAHQQANHFSIPVRFDSLTRNIILHKVETFTGNVLVTLSILNCQLYRLSRHLQSITSAVCGVWATGTVQRTLMRFYSTCFMKEIYSINLYLYIHFLRRPANSQPIQHWHPGRQQLELKCFLRMQNHSKVIRLHLPKSSQSNRDLPSLLCTRVECNAGHKYTNAVWKHWHLNTVCCA